MSKLHYSPLITLTGCHNSPESSKNELFIPSGSSNPLSIKVVDILGAQKTLKTNDFNSHIDVSSLANGVYFIIIEFENSIITKKFIVKKWRN